MVHVVLDPKTRVFPGQNERRINSALSGASYLAKTPAFHDPFAFKITKRRQKPSNAFTVAARGGAKGAKGA
jgi:hypothetical protein